VALAPPALEKPVPRALSGLISKFYFMKNGMHAYPHDLARFLRHKWPTAVSEEGEETNMWGTSLPEPPLLENLLSTCYQASMLREEEKPVRFRIIISRPDQFSSADFPPLGLHRSIFSHPRPCNETELRKLSPAAQFSRSLMGVTINNEGEWQIWGIVHSGTRWLQAYHGGRKVPPPFPAAPVIWVTGPGRLEVLRGTKTLATLIEGRIITPDVNVFESRMLWEYYAELRAEMLAYLASVTSTEQLDTILDPTLMATIGRHVLMRIISTMRETHQGGTLIFLPHHRHEEFTSKNPFITIKYQAIEKETQELFIRLILKTALALMEAYGHNTATGKRLGWQEYKASESTILALLDEAIFEVAHLIADFATVDGARALDAEGDQRQEEWTDNVGTRHRSVYYLCHQIPEALGVVISQDGNVRLVKWRDGQVTYWELATSFALSTP